MNRYLKVDTTQISIVQRLEDTYHKALTRRICIIQDESHSHLRPFCVSVDINRAHERCIAHYTHYSIGKHLL